MGTLEGGDVMTRSAAKKADRTWGRVLHEHFGRALVAPERPPNGQCECCNKAKKLYPDYDCGPNELGHSLSQHHRGWVCIPCRSLLKCIGEVGFQKLCKYLNRPTGNRSPANGRCQVCDRPSNNLDFEHDHWMEDIGYSRAESHRRWACRRCNSVILARADKIGVRKLSKYWNRNR